MDKFTLGGVEFNSRLILGTGKYRSNAILPDILKASGSEMITVALRRVDMTYPQENILNYIPKNVTLLPNTSGARNAEEAIRIARLARELGCGDWIKLEIIGDNKFLLPDNRATIEATKILADEGFKVMAYMSPDLIAGLAMVEAGAVAVMPLAAPIGSNRGVENMGLLKIMLEEISVPVIVDAGIGRPSQAAQVMEMGAAAVMLNTAVATAADPVGMAQAFGLAVKAGHMAYLAKLGRVKQQGEASSPLTGFLREE